MLSGVRGIASNPIFNARIFKEIIVRFSGFNEVSGPRISSFWHICLKSGEVFKGFEYP